MADKIPYQTDRWTDTDDIHFDDFQPALEEIICEAQTPLSVGVFGPWGSGKTSLLRMLQRKLENPQPGSGRPPIQTVWFTAWKYDRHEALWRAFIARVLEALYPREDGPKDLPRAERLRLAEPGESEQKLIDHLDRMAESLYRTVEWAELGEWQFQWPNAKAQLAKVPAALLLRAAMHADIAKDWGIDPDFADLLKRESNRQRLEHLRLMEQFSDAFEKALRMSHLGRSGRLVVFVDDLDRCLPEKAIEVLEAIKLFLEVEQTVFVLGMDAGVIEKGIEVRYGSLFRRAAPAADGSTQERGELPITGSSYLQKIIQVPFYLPPLQVADLAEFIETLTKDPETKVSRLDELTRGVFANGLLPNPRQAKRALNIFALLQRIAIASEATGRLGEGTIQPALLAKTVLIQTQFPELYSIWRSFPIAVKTLEGEYARQPTSDDEHLSGLYRRKAATTGAEGDDAPATEPGQRGGLLGPFLNDRRKYALLERLLLYPATDAERQRLTALGVDLSAARFTSVDLATLEAYLRLAGSAETEQRPTSVPVSEGQFSALLSNEPVRIDQALAELEADEQAEARKATLRDRLTEVLRSPAQPTAARISAGNVLARIGDPRFDPDAWYLPRITADEPLLGFVEIPPGPFVMGSDDHNNSEKPQHQVTLPLFYLARYPVTVAQWQAFCEASGYTPGDQRSLADPANHPVRYVTWHEAIRYCDWLTSTLREWPATPETLRALLTADGRISLPSEAEWERAARGTDGRRYPWGNEVTPDRANYANNVGGPTPVGAYPAGASPEGLLDMSGNVWEWTRSLWGKSSDKPAFGYPYTDRQAEREDLQAGDEVLRVLRGGAFSSSGNSLRSSYRDGLSPHFRSSYGGFRVRASRA